MAKKLLRDTLKILHIALIFLISVFCGVSNAQQNLSGGDVLIVSINTGSESGFDFIPLVDLKDGTELFFTNKQWDDKSKTFRGDGSIAKFTTTFEVSKGTTIHFGPGSSTDFKEEDFLNLSEEGDNLIVFQETDDNNPIFLYGVAWGKAAKWTYQENLRSDLPPGLDMDKHTALSLSNSGNHQYFVRNGASGTRSMLLQFVGNADFWNSDKEKFRPFGTSFTLLEPPVVLFAEPKQYLREDDKEFHVAVQVFGHDGSPLTGKISFQAESSTIDSASFSGSLSKSVNFEGIKGHGVRNVKFEINDDNKYIGRRIASFFLDSLSRGTYGDFRICNIIVEEDELPDIALVDMNIPNDNVKQNFNDDNPTDITGYPYLILQNKERVAVDLSGWKLNISDYKKTISENTVLLPDERILLVHADSMVANKLGEIYTQVEYIISEETIFDEVSGKLSLKNGNGSNIFEKEYIVPENIKNEESRVAGNVVQSADNSSATTNSNNIDFKTSSTKANSLFNLTVPETPGWYLLDRNLLALMGGPVTDSFVWDASKGIFTEKSISNGLDSPALALFLDKEKINELKAKSSSNNLVNAGSVAISFKLRADDTDLNGVIGHDEGLNLLSNSTFKKLPAYGIIVRLKEKLLGDEANPEIYLWNKRQAKYKKLNEFEFIPPMTPFWLKLDVPVAPNDVSLEVSQIINAPTPQVDDRTKDIVGRLELEFRDGDRFDRFMLKLSREEETGSLFNLNPAGIRKIQLPEKNTHSFFANKGAAPVSEMVISVLNKDKPVEIPLSLFSKPGEKELRISIWDNIPPGYRFQLLDKNNDNVISLDEDWSFKFNHNGGEILSNEGLSLSDYSPGFTERFSLRVLPPGYESAEEETEIPNELELYQNFPNPFNPVTTISFFLPQSEYVKLSIFNVVGQPVATLVDGSLSQGEHRMEWDASTMPSGIYIYQLEVGSKVMTRKMTLVK